MQTIDPKYDYTLTDKYPSEDVKAIIVEVIREMSKEPLTEEQIKHKQEFKAAWVGRVFRCKITGETIRIPEDVRERDMFSFGKSYIDVGRWPYYSRFGGDVEEITENKE